MHGQSYVYRVMLVDCRECNSVLMKIPAPGTMVPPGARAYSPWVGKVMELKLDGMLLRRSCPEWTTAPAAFL